MGSAIETESFQGYEMDGKSQQIEQSFRHEYGDEQNQFQNNRQSIIKVSSEHHEKGFKPQSNSDIRLRAEQKVQNLQSCLRFW